MIYLKLGDAGVWNSTMTWTPQCSSFLGLTAAGDDEGLNGGDKNISPMVIGI